ncbi:MAG: 16S rRNA (cytosine(1402)-N(4))-methyltransferase RsmH [Chloroflexi bacterium]|nr:16S rRNA (cytosine(1402)-N(4))-methyltransferase RsmH [Chloroflexota bacterium]
MTPQNVGPQPVHTPVLVKEVVEALAVASAGAIIDCTVGEGGHTEAILNAAPDCVVIGLDLDPAALAIAKERLSGHGDRVRLVNASYTTLAEQARFLEEISVMGVLLDLGLSSLQLEGEERGFSFQRNAPLDMRFGPDDDLTADDVVNRYTERDLAWVIHEYGEEPRARRVARAIVQRRPIRGTEHLAEVVQGALGRRGRIHPATRTFQGIRMEVNHEVDAIKTALAAAAETLHPGGRLVVISYHSIEDRLVKTTLRESTVLKALTKKPITPSGEEVALNARSRSARMRTAERLDEGTAFR